MPTGQGNCLFCMPATDGQLSMTKVISFTPGNAATSASSAAGCAWAAGTWFGVFAPAATPAPIVEQLYMACVQALNTPDMRERLSRLGAAPAPMKPAQFAAYLLQEQAKYQRIVKASGAKID